MVILYVLAAAMVILLVNGLVQQERVRLWKQQQEIAADKARAAREEHKKDATERVRNMLRERREEATGSTELRADGSARADGNGQVDAAAAEDAKARPARAAQSMTPPSAN